MELLLCYISKKVTSELYKLTNYKSNYTSTMYIKVITSLCNKDANQREEQGWHDDFSPEVHVFANTLRPRCVDRSLGGSTANWHHPPSPHVEHRKNLPESEGSSMTCSTRVALRGSCGASTMPLTKLFSGAPHKLLAGFDGDHHQAI